MNGFLQVHYKMSMLIHVEEPSVTFSMLYFSSAWEAQSTASCCMSSDISAFLITAFRSDIVYFLYFYQHYKEILRSKRTVLEMEGTNTSGCVHVFYIFFPST